MKPRIHSKRGGVLLVALVLVLVFFGVLACMQTLVVVQASMVTRALAQEHVRAEYRHRVRLALQEAAQSALDEREPALFEGRVERFAQGLGCQSGIVKVEALGGLETGRSWLPILSPKTESLSEAGETLALDYPHLRVSTTDWVERSVAKECRVGLVGLTGSGSRELLRFELRSIGVPLSSQPLCLYELPSEIGQMAGSGQSFDAGLGFRMRGAEAGWDELKVAQALPYHFRERASLAQTYASVFSNAAVGRLLAAAGPEGFILLHQGAVSGASGIMEQRVKVAALDLSARGVPRVQVVSAQDAGMVLKLEERVLGAVNDPLVLLVLGQNQEPLQVWLGGCERPVLLVGIHVVLSATPGTRWKGGIILSPGSRVAEGTTGLRVSHFSCHLPSAPVRGSVLVDLPTDRELAQVYPRTYYAGVRPLWP